MLRTNQMKSLSQKLSQKLDVLLPGTTVTALIPISYDTAESAGRLEYARFNRESPRRRRYRRSGVGMSPANVKTSWF